jgi:tetratricopeptide (TPR) repeat protein
MLRKGMIWMPMDKKDQLAELISNAETSFYNGQLQEAFSLSLSAIKLDENCADAYQCAANVCMSLSRYEDAIEYYQKVQIYIMLLTQIEMNL